MVFVVGVGWRYGPGASGGSLGVGFLGGSALGLRPWPVWGISFILAHVSDVTD